MLKIALIAVGVLCSAIVLLFAVAAMRPDDFKVTRSMVMSAPASVIYPHVSNFNRWNDWSPWAKLDPTCKNSFTGEPAQVGSTFAWDGNSAVGAGKMTLVELQPNQRVQIQLDFEKPFKGTNTAEFTFQPQGDQTLVTWTMSGKNNLIGKTIGLFMNCDKMVGGQFEQGLGQIKAIAEASSSKSKIN